MSNSGAVSSVTESFLAHFVPYCDEADLTMAELLAQFAAHFEEYFTDPNKRKLIKFALLIDDETQLNAEIALEEMVKCLPNRFQNARRWTVVPGRDVDWGQTYLANLMARRGEYCSLVRSPVADIQLLQALASIASLWRRILESVPTAENRDKRIAMLRGIEKALPTGHATWSLAITRRLSHFDRKSTAAIDAAMKLWEGDENRSKGLADKFRKWLKENGEEIATDKLNNLFEWTVKLAIVHAATKDSWQIKSTKRDGKLGDIILKKENWRLRISKGKPLDGKGKSIIADSGDDRVTELKIRAGEGATGQQPDVVLTFFEEGNALAVTFLADAKNNQELSVKKDGKKESSYINPSILKSAGYVYAFEKWLLQEQPRFTLFFWQNVKKLLDADISCDQLNDQQIVNQIIHSLRQDTSMPDILCFDRRVMHENIDILCAWLARLENLALTELGKVPMSKATLEQPVA